MPLIGVLLWVGVYGYNIYSLLRIGRRHAVLPSDRWPLGHYVSFRSAWKWLE